MGRFIVVRRPYGYVVSDQWTGAWVTDEIKSRAAAHRKADTLNAVSARERHTPADCPACGTAVCSYGGKAV